MSDPPAPSEPAIAPGGDHPAPAPLTPDAVATILADFQAWLQEGNWNTGAAGEAPLPAASMLPLPHGVDLFTLVGQFTALRHEVNLQTKAARTAVEQNAEALRLLAASQKQAEAEPAEDNEALRPLIKTFVDIADALTLSLRQMEKLRDAIEPLLDELEPDDIDEEDDFDKEDLELLIEPEPPPRKPGFFARLFGATPPVPPPPPALVAPEERKSLDWLKPTADRLRQLTEAAADGYAMSLRRVERSLPALDLERLVCVGEPYDPERMEVVEVLGDTDDPAGTVVEEVRPGYLWRGKLFRVAQVKVAR